jgi:ArsR family transcriptional regulator
MDYNQKKYLLKTFKNLANAHRISILDLLLQKNNHKLTVNQICDKLDLKQSNVSGHLVKMREAGILRASQDGANMYYSIKDPIIEKFLRN